MESDRRQSGQASKGVILLSPEARKVILIVNRPVNNMPKNILENRNFDQPDGSARANPQSPLPYTFKSGPNRRAADPNDHTASGCFLLRRVFIGVVSFLSEHYGAWPVWRTEDLFGMGWFIVFIMDTF